MIEKPQRYALVGMKFRKAEEFVAALPPDAPLVLVRDPSNKFDVNAIEVWAFDPAGVARHVGFIPKTQNAVLAKFIDSAGKPWTKPQPVLALDAPMPSEIEVYRAVDARLHLGNNEYPLVEVV